MKKLPILCFTVALTALIVAVLLPTTGCMTSKTSTVTTNANGTFLTNTVVTVNEANLALDSSVLQSATAISVSLVIAKDPSTIPLLKNAQVTVDGILNGANTNTTAQVLTTLKASGNVALTSEITSLMGTVSALEQNLLAKYGTGVAGQITLSLTRAVDAGLLVGLGQVNK